MSLPAIQANSLSALTALASSPPSYPRNPTHVRHEPLVLYIARVPGSKDVFLSPMKPREKVVTAEDIQSSLYYVHIETPEDAGFVSRPQFREPEYSEHPGQTSSQPSTRVVPRKAVPATPVHAGATAPLRKPVPGTMTSRVNVENQQNVNAGRFAQRQDSLAPGNVPISPQNGSDTFENRRMGHKTSSSHETISSCGTSLTLIRRDPASGSQWNVARIDDPIIPEISSLSNGSAAKRKLGAPMYIDVLNPGYSKFLHSNDLNAISLPHSSGASGKSDQTELGSFQEGSEQRQDTYPDPNIFRRRMWMEGAQFSSLGFGHRSRSSYDYSSGRPTSRGSYDSQSQQASVDMRPSPSPLFLTRGDQPYTTIQVSDKQTTFRGYVFTSPWNGRCEFVTGAGGGSLKCRHILPSPQNAPTAASSLSELRFNLPSSSTPSKLRSDETSKRSSLFHRGRHSRNNSTLSVSQDSEFENSRYPEGRMDLSLGQEFAGGGFGGKQAKLGKIIIEDEGIKMIDLLVAANLGLWWRAYERALVPSGEERSSF